VLALDLVFSLLAGVDLYFLAGHTDRYFAWTIKLPVTATFLGAGYLSAVVTLVLARRATDWRNVRSIAVMGFALTTTTLLVTLWHITQFHLAEGPAFARVAAWAWLAVYLTIPILLATIFVRQQRAARGGVTNAAEPILPPVRAALRTQAIGASILGLGLVFRPSAFDVVWPWPLPPLSAGAVGAWLVTIAAGSSWALHEKDGGRLRRDLAGPAAFLALVVLGAARFPAPLAADAWQDWTFFGAVGVTLLGLVSAGYLQKRAVVTLAAPQARG
jgi:hypothetical protein